MPIPDKGIAKAVKNLFINGVHEEKHMLLEMEPKIEGLAHRVQYVKTLLKDLREKNGMEVKRNRSHGKKHKVKSKQLALPFNRKPKVEIHAVSPSVSDAEAMLKIKLQEAEIDLEYTKLQCESLLDTVSELRREIIRLQVIIDYLEGKK